MTLNQLSVRVGGGGDMQNTFRPVQVSQVAPCWRAAAPLSEHASRHTAGVRCTKLFVWFCVT